MKQMTDLELLKLNKGQLFVYKLKKFFCAIPAWFKKTGIKIGRFFKNLGISIYIFFRDLVMTFVKGDWKTRVSYVILGFGSLARGQILRGILFLLMEIVFIWYMIATGGYYVGKLNSLGMKQPEMMEDGTIIYGGNRYSDKVDIITRIGQQAVVNIDLKFGYLYNGIQIVSGN